MRCHRCLAIGGAKEAKHTNCLAAALADIILNSTLSRLVGSPGAVFQGSAGPAASPRVMYKELDGRRGELCSSVVVWQKAAEKKLLARARLL